MSFQSPLWTLCPDYDMGTHTPKQLGDTRSARTVANHVRDLTVQDDVGRSHEPVYNGATDAISVLNDLLRLGIVNNPSGKIKPHIIFSQAERTSCSLFGTAANRAG